MTTKIKRSLVKTFLNTTPLAAATYALIGDGVVAGKISMNPKTTEEQYISVDSASFSVDSYAPNMPIEMTARVGDAVWTFIDTMRILRATGVGAETDVVNVWAYKAGGPTAYPAEKQPVVITFEDFGGEGGANNKVNFTLNYNGAPVPGTFNTTTSAFTAS